MSRASVLFEQADALQWVLRHPLNRGKSWRALARWLSWHVGARLGGAERTIRFVAGTRLFGGPDLTTANVQHYVGLGELDVMGFLLHLLRPDDLMVDVGANVGAVSVLAGAVGARVVAFEPVPATYKWLVRNVVLNDLGSRIECLNLAVGERPGSVRMSVGQGAGNHVASTPSEDAVEIESESLDRRLAGRAVSVVKMDVEGFEVPAVRGATSVLGQPGVRAVVAELKGHGNRYGYDEAEVFRTLAGLGFEACTYDALARVLAPLAEAPERPDNVIFVRDRTRMQADLAAAPARPIIWDRSV